jgi:hypothetical protein
MGEVRYRIVSSDAELDKATAPALRKELVILETWLLEDGSAVAYVMHELPTGEHDEFDRSDKVFDKFGQVIRLKPPGDKNYEFLARTTRDGDGLRVWHNAEDCKKRLKPLGKYITNKMVTAANKANYGDSESPDGAMASAEGNSEEASSSS